MDTQLEAHRVELVGQGLEAHVDAVLHGRGEARGRGQVAAVVVDDVVLVAPLKTVAQRATVKGFHKIRT